MLVLDDDCLFHCNYVEEFKRVVAHPRLVVHCTLYAYFGRCGAPIDKSSDRGGILLLGSAIWIDGTYPRRGEIREICVLTLSGPFVGGWNAVWADMEKARKVRRQFGMATHIYQETGVQEQMCYNVNSKTFGSFGVIYHRAGDITSVDLSLNRS